LQKKAQYSYQFTLDTINAFKITAENTKINRARKIRTKEYKALIQLRKAINRQNNKYQKALRFTKSKRLDLITTEVISRSPDSWFSYVIINKGSRSGITKHNPVINDQGLVGEITEVFLNHAKVSLLTDRKIRIGCEIEKNGSVGVCEGRGFNQLMVNYIPITSEVASGDYIVTSGHSNKYPPGIHLGIITQTKGNITDIFREISAIPIVDLSKLDLLFIIKD